MSTAARHNTKTNYAKGSAPTYRKQRSDTSYRLESHVKSFAEDLSESVKYASEEKNHFGFVIIGEYRTPAKNEDGDWVHDPVLTHWNGNPDVDDPSIGGTPIATLLEGPIRRGEGRADPTLLPQGRTSLYYLREWMYTWPENKDRQYSVELARSNKTLQVYLIWNREKWNDYCTDRVETRRRDDELEAQQQQQQAQQAEGRRTMTLDEYKALRGH